MGPFIVSGVDRDKTLVFVTDDKASKLPKPFGFAQVKPYNSIAQSASEFFATLLRAFQKYRTPEELIHRNTYLTEVLDKSDPSATPQP